MNTDPRPLAAEPAAPFRLATHSTTPAASNRPPSAATIASLQEALQRLESELIAFHRLAMLGTMSAMVAHEFNNLATPVLALSEFALKQGDVPLMRKALERTVTNTRKGVAIAEHLLGLAKAGDSSPQVCSVGSAVHEALEAAGRPLDRDRIELRVEAPVDLFVLARPILFEQVILNLVINARKAMHDQSGTLTIRARRDGDFVEIEVRDTGKGIPPERVQELFNPFLAGQPDGQPRDWYPIGLGLNVCRTIARQHNATITVAPNEGCGCCFTLRWPAADPG